MRLLLTFVSTVWVCFSYAQEMGQKYVADASSSKLEWTGKKLTGEHYGEIKLRGGELTFSKDKLVGGKFEMDMNSITCTDITDAKSNKRLVDHLRSEDFFSVVRHPTSHFVITSVEAKSATEYNVTGNLTIKGKTNPLTFPVKLRRENNRLLAEATMTFDRSMYDVKFGSQSFYENLGDKLVYDDIDLAIKLSFNQEQAN
jgi:polyisoprenoid-binding protein YceI